MGYEIEGMWSAIFSGTEPQAPLVLGILPYGVNKCRFPTNTDIRKLPEDEVSSNINYMEPCAVVCHKVFPNNQDKSAEQ